MSDQPSLDLAPSNEAMMFAFACMWDEMSARLAHEHALIFGAREDRDARMGTNPEVRAARTGA